jgi:ABC-type transport system involved in Fe-S cluster assembly fused permease/ATPase subunit
MHTGLPQNTLHDKIEEVAWVKTSHGNKRVREILSYFDGALSLAQRHSAESDKFSRNTEFGHDGIYTIS